jgi:hypothetical protein
MIRFLNKKVLALSGMAGTLLSLSVLAQDKTPVPAGTPVTITVQPAVPTAPTVSIVLGPRHGHVTPTRCGCTHMGGGNIDVAQPSPDTVVITMTGAAIAYGSVRNAEATMAFDLEQCFELKYENPKVKKSKLSMEGRVIGLLRGHCKGDSAAYDNACASVGCDTVSLLHLCVPPHGVGGCEFLSVNDHDGPYESPIAAGKYTLHQTFMVSAHAHGYVVPCKGPAAEFAPDPALDPLWLPYKEPFHGAAKKDFGFQITLKAIDDSESANGNGNGEKKEEAPTRETLPAPKEELKK